jgi:hypothetical protein
MLVLHNHQRCFVEDFMVLPVEKPCIILIPVANDALVSIYSNLINSIMDKATVQFRDEVFFDELVGDLRWQRIRCHGKYG